MDKKISNPFPRKAVLQLSVADRQALLDHARYSAPNEGCGLLAGEIRTEAGGRLVKRITQVIFIPNADPSPSWFRFEPQMQHQAEIRMREQGLDLAGIYHSHPASPAFPSPTDLTQAHWPGTNELLYPLASWLIVSLTEDRLPPLRSFLIHGMHHPEDVQEETIQSFDPQSDA